MTQQLDNILISMGLKADELKAVKSRWIVYSGLLAMSGVSLMLVVGIVSNLSGATA
ncbi:hypothetical protein [Parvularcula sp. LCG005]|uniref:hypothetical protein n=1 Tax=Parvularcula sp. LCG005 TaxID=3078805 RepID=UPI002943D6F2|nr:hypothetical protein [Parvularcula sp. LCG005]WOI53075.1 hypothetical protein RUI03_13060 [Parvularcula sp. LCG005]